MDGSGLPLKGNLFPIELQLEMDCCSVSTFVEGVATTTIATIVTTLGENFSTTKTLAIS